METPFLLLEQPSNPTRQRCDEDRRGVAMATIPVIKGLATAFLVLLQQHCARMMAGVVSEKDIRTYLSAFEDNELQDDIDGVGASQGRQMIPMEERFWERVGRFMPSANLKTLFRCT